MFAIIRQRLIIDTGRRFVHCQFWATAAAAAVAAAAASAVSLSATRLSHCPIRGIFILDVIADNTARYFN